MSEAEVHFRKSLEIKPTESEAANNLGCVLLKGGHVTEAMEEFQKAVKINPNYATAEQNLAHAQAMIGQNHGPK